MPSSPSAIAPTCWRAVSCLRGRFEHIVADAGLTAQQKRVQVFALWNDCADDETGSEGQRAIEQLVRLYMPRGSALGYAPRELDELNGQRMGRRVFDPYASARPDAGTEPSVHEG